ncbi:MAG: YfiR/HmsC family protein [Elusimicrobia bacterium]|nr:YfiR/HmsC family protein [Candidatus Liberimonas magnetica]
MKIKYILNLLFSCLFFLNVLSAAFLPYNLQAALLLKILNYDQNIGRNASNGVITVGIIYENNRKWIESSKSLLLELLVFKGRNVKVKNYSIDFCLLPFEAVNQPETIKEKNINVLYLSIETPEKIAKVTEFAKKSGILTVCGQDSYEKMKNGISVGFSLENEKPAITLNNDSAVKEGSNFSKEFAALAKAYK